MPPNDDPGENIVLALPKGRILAEVMPLVRAAGIEPEPAFDDPRARQLRFATNHPNIEIVRVRSFDAATFVAFGAAHMGVVGADVLMEFDYPEIQAPLDLGIGFCRMVVAEPEAMKKGDDPDHWSHVRIATNDSGSLVWRTLSFLVSYYTYLTPLLTERGIPRYSGAQTHTCCSYTYWVTYTRRVGIDNLHAHTHTNAHVMLLGPMAGSGWRAPKAP